MSGVVAFVCSGQGSQRNGMIQEIAGADQALLDELRTEAGDSITEPVVDAWLNPEIKNAPNSIVQGAIFFATMLHFRAAMKSGADPTAVSGLSFGTYAAAVISGALDLGTAFWLVLQRGLITERIAAQDGGGLAAISGRFDLDAVTRHCSYGLKGTNELATVANINSPRQIVISGNEEGLLAMESWASANGLAFKRLCIHGAFHSPLMNAAAYEMALSLESVVFSPFKLPFYCSVTGKLVTNPEDLRQILADQINRPCNWIETTEAMLNDGIDQFCEIGPGKALVGFCRDIERQWKRRDTL